MTRDRSDEPDVSHVFDQTNGVVDLGPDESMDDSTDEASKTRNRAISGIAMMSVKKP